MCCSACWEIKDPVIDRRARSIGRPCRLDQSHGSVANWHRTSICWSPMAGSGRTAPSCTDRLLEEYDVVLGHTTLPFHPDTPEEGLPLEELFASRSSSRGSAREPCCWRRGVRGRCGCLKALFKAYRVMLSPRLTRSGR